MLAKARLGLVVASSLDKLSSYALLIYLREGAVGRAGEAQTGLFGVGRGEAR